MSETSAGWPGLVAEALMVRYLRAELAGTFRAVLDRLQVEDGPPLDVTAAGWLPHRGDYGTEYAGELVELVEARCCGAGRGCANAGTRAAIKRVGGAGGTCRLLMLMSLPERVHGFAHDGGRVPDDAPDYAGQPAPRCDRYVERPGPVRRGPRPRQPDSLF